ncbi:MAG: hypothetical protein EBR82_78410 [Caulobacteraceae bacterium]|nr:hypothetical protein [Caulobacteraceae bacterium]
MVELPEFIRKLQHRSPEPAEPTVGQSIAQLYYEFNEGQKIDGWINTPRGCWVDYQLKWFERRQREKALSDRGLSSDSGPRNDKSRGKGGRAA